MRQLKAWLLAPLFATLAVLFAPVAASAACAAGAYTSNTSGVTINGVLDALCDGPSDVRGTGTIASATPNAAYTIALNGKGVVSFVVTGLTASGATLTIESSDDGGTTWAASNGVGPNNGAVFTTLTTDQQFRVNVAGRTNLRLRVSATGSGTITVTSNQSAATGLMGLSAPPPGQLFYNDTTATLTANSTYTGTARDVGVPAGSTQPWGYFTGFFRADQAGTASLEASNDNSTFVTCATAALAASTPLFLQCPIVTRYFRVKLVNGSTNQGSLIVNSAFSGN